MKLNALTAACVLILGAALPAPAAAQNRETRQMMADIRMLQEQAQQLNNLIAQLAETLKTMDTRLSGRIDDQMNANRKSMADQKLVIDSLPRDLGVLREKVDGNGIRLGSLSQEVDALRQLVTQMNAQRTTTLFPPDDAANGLVPEPLPDQAAAAPTSAVGASPQKIWFAAYSDYTGGDYELAISGFDAYIKSFPRSEQAGEAQLTIGHSYLNLRQYEKAAEAYETVIRTYPGSNVLPEAYYKKGLALQSLGQTDAAQEAFETAIKMYPDSDAARLAAQRMPQLKKP